MPLFLFFPKSSDGYVETELVFALVNFAASFKDFEGIINMLNTDATGAFPLPTAYWSMDNSSLLDSTTILDNVGTAHGTLTNTPTTGIAGQVQQAFSFALVNSEFVDMGSVGILDWGAGNGSVGAWFKTSTNYSVLDGNIVSNGSINAGGKRYHLYIEGGTNFIAFGIDDNTALQKAASSIVFNDGNWHHVIGVREGSDIKLYVDGILVDTTSIGSYGNLDDPNGVRVGCTVDFISGLEDHFFDGEIDEVFVLTGQALTATQVFEIYSLGATNQKLVS
jgi:hypothetical protein